MKLLRELTRWQPSETGDDREDGVTIDPSELDQLDDAPFDEDQGTDTIDDTESSQSDTDVFDLDTPPEESNDDVNVPSEDTIAGDQPDDISQLADQASEDPNRQGVIRHVDGASLVYKRKAADGTYTELWIYKLTPDILSNETDVKRAILAGTDISQGNSTSEDGSQTYEIWTVSDAEMLLIKGMQN